MHDHGLLGLLDTEVNLLCLPTPQREEDSIDLSIMEAGTSRLGRMIADAPDWHTVVVKNTTVSGSTADTITLIVEHESRKSASKGTRLQPLTDDKPKVLVEVNGTPFIKDIFDNLIDAGATEMVVVVDYKAEQIIDRYGDEYRDVPITYTHQREQLGLAHAIL